MTVESCVQSGASLYYLVGEWNGYGLYESRNYRMGGRGWLARHPATGWETRGGVVGTRQAVTDAVRRHANGHPHWSAR